MIYYTKGNIFEANADALVNPVNCVGAMGAGLAKQFADKFPEMLKPYQSLCDNGRLRPGEIWTFEAEDTTIVNLATKGHWRQESKLEWVDQGLLNLADLIEERSFESVAIPALGCGFGRLKWEDVKYLIKEHLVELDCKVLVFEPNPRTFHKSKKPLRPNPTQDGPSFHGLLNTTAVAE